MFQSSVTKEKPSDIWQFPVDPTLSCVCCNSVSPCLGNGLNAHLCSFAEKAAPSWDLGAGLGHKAGQRVYWSPCTLKGCYVWDCPLGGRFPGLVFGCFCGSLWCFHCPLSSLMPLLDAHSLTPLHCAWPQNVSIFPPSLNCYQCKVNKRGYFSSFPGCFVSLHTVQHSRAPQQGTPGTMGLLVVKGVTRWCKYVLI